MGRQGKVQGLTGGTTSQSAACGVTAGQGTCHMDWKSHKHHQVQGTQTASLHPRQVRDSKLIPQVPPALGMATELSGQVWPFHVSK